MDTQKLLVIDGQQRLKTLLYFFNGTYPDQRSFSIRLPGSPFNESTYESLPDPQRRRLNDSILHATVVRQDEPEDNQNSIYMLFERLNTENTALAPQEIRIALYHGEFIDLLRSLNLNSHWRAIFGVESSRKRTKS